VAVLHRHRAKSPAEKKNLSKDRYFSEFRACTVLHIIKNMVQPKKPNYKQSNIGIARTFRHQSHHHSSSGLTSEPASTRSSTLAATTPPNSAPPSIIEPVDVPALNSWGQSEEETREDLPGHGNLIIIDDNSEDNGGDSDEGYGSDDCMSEMEGQELRDSLELQMEGEIEQIQEGRAYEVLMREINAGQWKKAETNRSLGYNGLSRRKKQLDTQKAEQAKKLKTS